MGFYQVNSQLHFAYKVEKSQLSRHIREEKKMYTKSFVKSEYLYIFFMSNKKNMQIYKRVQRVEKARAKENKNNRELYAGYKCSFVECHFRCVQMFGVCTTKLTPLLSSLLSVHVLE